MGWIWFIPTFHIPSTATPDPTKILLARKEIDFPLGIGAALVDVEISISPCSALEAEEGIIQPPARQTSEDSREGDGRSEPAGFAAAVTAAAGLGEVVDAKQAAED